MSYTDAQLQAFWFGGTEDAPGDENNFLPGNYVTMKLAAYLLTTPRLARIRCRLRCKAFVLSAEQTFWVCKY